MTVHTRGMPWARATLCMALALSMRYWDTAAHAADPAGPTLAPTLELPPVEVTAYRVPTSTREATQDVTVISRKDIEERAGATAIGLLEQVPGLQIDQPGSPGGLSSVYIRGSDPNHVLVLIDGVRVNDPTNSRGGGYDLSNLDSNDIERIEVIRGAASALYGADAMGGIINIVTRRGAPGSFHGGAAGGIGGQSYGTIHGDLSGGGDRVFGYLGVSNLRDGRDADGGHIDLTTFTGNLTWLLDERLSAKFGARYNDRSSANFPDESGGVRLATDRTLEQRRGNETGYWGKLTWDATDKLEITADASFYRHVEDIDSPDVGPGPGGFVPATKSHAQLDRDNARVAGLLHLPARTDVTIGYEHQHEVGQSSILTPLIAPDPIPFRLGRNTESPFAEFATRAIPHLFVHAGVRRDSVSGVDGQTSPSAGARYDIEATGTALKADYSKGFKPPSFYALGFTPVANPNLRPEHGKTGSAGIEQRWWDGRAVLGLSLFKTHYRDLVDFDTTTFQLVNRNNVDIRGGEIEFALRPTDALKLRAHYTRLTTRIVETGDQLRQRPGKRAGLELEYAVGERCSLSWNTTYVADVLDSSIPTGDLALPGYTKTDVAVRYRITDRIAATAAVDNLFDKRYEQFVGFANPGRRARIALSATF